MVEPSAGGTGVPQRISDAVAQRFAERVSEVRRNIGLVIKGKPDEIEPDA